MSVRQPSSTACPRARPSSCAPSRGMRTLRAPSWRSSTTAAPSSPTRARGRLRRGRLRSLARRGRSRLAGRRRVSDPDPNSDHLELTLLGGVVRDGHSPPAARFGRPPVTAGRDGVGVAPRQAPRGHRSASTSRPAASASRHRAACRLWATSCGLRVGVGGRRSMDRGPRGPRGVAELRPLGWPASSCVRAAPPSSSFCSPGATHTASAPPDTWRACSGRALEWWANTERVPVETRPAPTRPFL